VNIRWKANKHSYSLKALEIILNEEILDLFGEIPFFLSLERTHLSHSKD